MFFADDQKNRRTEHGLPWTSKIGVRKSTPAYEPDREKTVFENVRQSNQGPLPDRDLLRIYERVVDVMRQSEMEEMKVLRPTRFDALGDTEIDPEVND